MISNVPASAIVTLFIHQQSGICALFRSLRGSVFVVMYKPLSDTLHLMFTVSRGDWERLSTSNASMRRLLAAVQRAKQMLPTQADMRGRSEMWRGHRASTSWCSFFFFFFFPDTSVFCMELGCKLCIRPPTWRSGLHLPDLYLKTCPTWRLSFCSYSS